MRMRGFCGSADGDARRSSCDVSRRQLSTTAQTVAVQTMRMNGKSEPNTGLTREPMLLIVGFLVVCLAILSMLRISFAHSKDAAALGWMSEQWLGEHRRARSG